MGGCGQCESFPDAWPTLLTQLHVSDHHPAARPGKGISGDNEQQLQ